MPPRRIKASNLRATSAKRLRIRQYIEETLDAIYNNIEAAHSGDQDKISFALSSTYDVPNMSNADAMLFIHAEIMRDLHNQEYEAVIDTERSVLHISWGKELSNPVTDNVRLYLASHSVRIDDARQRAEKREHHRNNSIVRSNGRG